MSLINILIYKKNKISLKNNNHLNGSYFLKKNNLYILILQL